MTKSVVIKTLVALTLLLLASSGRAEPVKIAFLPDIHFQDVYGTFSDDAFKGLETETSDGKQFATIRSMQAQLASTRLFNENYFALLAALDDIGQRGVKLVALPGDFSDNGQPINVRGLNQVLEHYTKKYGLRFFAVHGNHDPNRPFTQPAGHNDYLGENGQEQPIYSSAHKACNRPAVAANQGKKSLAVICSNDVQEWGYQEIMETLGDKGFYPQPEYLYFATPFSAYTSANYDFNSAVLQSSYAQRHYEICAQGSGGKYQQAAYTQCFNVPDASYLVEPVNDLWLLAIDANVYIPKSSADQHPHNPANFEGSGNAGYNKVVSHKKHLVEWIKTVVKQAQQQGKTLLAFSHFPMSEFYDGASADIAQLWGGNTFQLARKPLNETVKALAETGLKLHVGGHMHFNDTGLYRDDKHSLLNIQAPTLAGYIPGYKLLHIDGEQVEVETIVMDEVPRFKELFPLYQAEWNYLNSVHDPKIWNKAILQSKNYQQFTDWHLTELVRLRFIPAEWPKELTDTLLPMTGLQMLTRAAPDNYHQLIAQNASSATSLQSWNGQDLIKDFYRLRNADQLATLDISPLRLSEYKLIATAYSQHHSDVFSRRFAKMLKVLSQFTTTTPSDHFSFNLKSGQLIDLGKE